MLPHDSSWRQNRAYPVFFAKRPSRMAEKCGCARFPLDAGTRDLGFCGCGRVRRPRKPCVPSLFRQAAAPDGRKMRVRTFPPSALGRKMRVRTFCPAARSENDRACASQCSWRESAGMRVSPGCPWWESAGVRLPTRFGMPRRPLSWAEPVLDSGEIHAPLGGLQCKVARLPSISTSCRRSGDALRLKGG